MWSVCPAVFSLSCIIPLCDNLQLHPAMPVLVSDINYSRHLNKYKLYKWQACHACQDARKMSLLDFQPLLNVNGTERSTFLRIKQFLQVVSFILTILSSNHKLMAYMGYMQRICVTVLGFSILMNAKQQDSLCGFEGRNDTDK